MRVVAAVINHNDTLLACRRAAHKSLPGKWEFPGGKVEVGESDRDALVREIREELGVDISIGALIEISFEERLNLKIEMHTYSAQLVGEVPASSTDHDLLQWVAVSDLQKLDWAALDIPVVEKLQLI